MIKNKKASIFIFILILVNVILILGYVVFNNVTIINNNIDIGKNAEEVFKNVQQKGDINIQTDLQYNGNGNGFEDFISCPTNITMSGSTLKSTGLTSEMHYELGSYFCVGTHNSKEFRIYFDNVTHDFNRAYFEGDIVNLITGVSGGGITQGSNLAPGSTVVSSPRKKAYYDKSYAYDNTINNRYYKSGKDTYRYIKFDLGTEKELYSIELFKKSHWWNGYWDFGYVDYFDGAGNYIISSTLTGMKNKTYNLIDLRAAGITNKIRYVEIVEYSGNNKYLDLKEVKIYESINSGPTGTNTRVGEREFNDSDSTLMSFDQTGVGGNDGIDDNFNSDDYKVTSTGSIYYPGGFQDDDVIPRLTIFGDVRDSTVYQNIFWSNYETNNFIDGNTNNNDILNLKIGDITDGNLYLDLFSDSKDIKYDLKVYEFDRNAYKNEYTLLLKNAYEIKDSTLNSGFIQLYNGDIGLSTSKTSNTMSFDFKNKDYALFLINKLNSNLSYRIIGQSDTGTGLYINPIDDSGTGTIKTLSNHIIIGDEKNFIGEQFIVVGYK